MHALLEYRNVHARVTSGSATVPTYGKVISYLNQPRPSCKPEASCLQLLSNCIKVQRLRQQFGGNFVDSDSTEYSATCSGYSATASGCSTTRFECSTSQSADWFTSSAPVDQVTWPINYCIKPSSEPASCTSRRQHTTGYCRQHDMTIVAGILQPTSLTRA
jgi:hypothetical protein